MAVDGRLVLCIFCHSEKHKKRTRTKEHYTTVYTCTLCRDGMARARLSCFIHFFAKELECVFACLAPSPPNQREHGRKRIQFFYSYY